MAQSSAEAGHAIEGAGKTLLESFNRTSADIAKLGTDMGSTIGEELLGRLEVIGLRLEAMAEAVQRGASGAQSAAQGLNTGADAIHGASEGFRTASQNLTAAAEPLRASHERIEATLRRGGEGAPSPHDLTRSMPASPSPGPTRAPPTPALCLGGWGWSIPPIPPGL